MCPLEIEHCCLAVALLILPLPFGICFSLDRKRRNHVKWEENGKRFDSWDSDSFKLVAQISYFHQLESSLSILSDTPHRSQMTENKVLWERRMIWTRKSKRTVWLERRVRTETNDFENRCVILIREGPPTSLKAFGPDSFNFRLKIISPNRASATLLHVPWRV